MKSSSISSHLTYIVAFTFFVLTLCWGSSDAMAQSAEDILSHSRSVYERLNSYSDSGVVVNEFGKSSQNRHTFTTFFKRSPRSFVFDFHSQAGDRYVVWADQDAFHTWWKTTNQTTDYPNPNNIPAVNQSVRQTKGAVTIISELLFHTDAILGVLANFANSAVDGTEQIDGHKCYRIIGRVSDFYGKTGREVNVRTGTLWIDAESYLVRKEREDFAALPGQTERSVIMFNPKANPDLDSGTLRFAPPNLQ